MTDTNTNSNTGLNTEPENVSEAEASEAAIPSAPSPEELLGEWKNKAAYLAAEIDNMKKRFVREKSDVIRMANDELIRAILPVFDNLDLALKSIRDMETQSDNEILNNKIFINLLKGVEMTLSHFQQTLERVGVHKMESVGTTFDPTMHEAMGQSTDENFENDQVSSEFQKGFTLHGRVIRPAKVAVNKI